MKDVVAREATEGLLRCDVFRQADDAPPDATAVADSSNDPGGARRGVRQCGDSLLRAATTFLGSTRGTVAQACEIPLHSARARYGGRRGG